MHFNPPVDRCVTLLLAPVASPLLRFELNFERVPSRIIEKVRRLKDVEQKKYSWRRVDGNFEIDSTCDRVFDKFGLVDLCGVGIVGSKQQAKVNKYP